MDHLGVTDSNSVACSESFVFFLWLNRTSLPLIVETRWIVTPVSAATKRVYADNEALISGVSGLKNIIAPFYATPALFIVLKMY